MTIFSSQSHQRRIKKKNSWQCGAHHPVGIANMKTTGKRLLNAIEDPCSAIHNGFQTGPMKTALTNIVTACYKS